MPPATRRTRTKKRASARSSAGPGVTRPADDGQERADLQAAVPICTVCADELRALGLPYRVVLRCAHDRR